MGRPTLHPATGLVASAQRLAASGSTAAVTISAVARESGAPVGTIYHRFGSRDDLLAAAWLDAVAAYQRELVPALLSPGGLPGLAAAVGTTAWARRDPVRARLLVLHGAREFGAENWSPSSREAAQGLASELEGALERFCVRHLGQAGGDNRRLATFAVLDLPQAAVRRYLAVGMPPPEAVDAYLAAALAALIPTPDRN
jgi:AcrR family transcriptional regulator